MHKGKKDMRCDTTKADIIHIVKTLGVNMGDITDVRALKKGMTNRSFLVTGENGKFIVRIPGEGTDKLINRHGEVASYCAIDGKQIGDELLYIDARNGYKISKFWENARCCDAENENDVSRCMRRLRAFHELKLKVTHEFDLFRQIAFYESLWGDKSSTYEDYHKTKSELWSLRPYIDAHVEKKVLTHIDAVPDNFLFVKDAEGKEEIRLIDWEYAGMQDPHVDLAMFCIYSLYDREKIDRLIDIYFSGECKREIRIKIYCYIAAGGLLWSNWCEYKKSMGVVFGQYALCQYQYAKEYCRIVREGAWSS